MNERERDEDRWSGRVLELAAAAIGLGVGAAFYYLLNKRSVQPNTSDSTSQNWIYEEPTSLQVPSQDTSAYTTTSDYTSSDTSIHDSDSDSNNSSNFPNHASNTSNDSNGSPNDSPSIDSLNSDSSLNESYVTISDCYSSSSDDESPANDQKLNITSSDCESLTDVNPCADESIASIDCDSIPDVNPCDGTSCVSLNQGNPFESDNEWDVTHSPLDMPLVQRMDQDCRSHWGKRQRERPWSLEECSICFDVMLLVQPLMELPCAHRFHAACIRPWLREHQTCPNCRKEAESIIHASFF